ncbi:hypothetical protein QC762_307720 [Podospora pseudocomata]|uniref:Gastric mucin n=1 Tax=Podospora pseudocomata TaxID=2093779 RepID=A0ABR0GJV5_9PEZI|nr:hypothetical protein QC762_307720 [Podospora pseudocomata]
MAESTGSPELNGCLVALEGPARLVATQLRLLPTSPRILILPALQHYLGNINKDDYPDATQLIHRVHVAAQKRHAEAQEFLQQSTPEEGRIVFTHGGTVGAHALCLSAISKQQTSGNVEEADLVFCQLASKGAAHLAREASRRCAKNHGPSVAALEKFKVVAASPRSAGLVPRPLRLRNATPSLPKETVLVQQKERHSPFEDPVIRAMRAADLLDRETAFLQPAGGINEVDMTVRIVEIRKRKVVRRSMSLSVVDSVGGSVVLGGSKGSSSSAASSDGRDSKNALITSPCSSCDKTLPSSTRRTPLRIEIPSPLIRWTGIREEPPPPLAEGDQSDPSFSSRGCRVENERPRSADDKLTFENNLTSLGRHLGVDRDDDNMGGYHRLGLFEQWGRGHNANLTTEPPPSDHESTAAAATETDKTFEPVLPLREDLVIHLSTPQSDESLDLVFQGFQRGDYTDRMPVRTTAALDSGVLEKGYDNTRRMLESLSPGAFAEAAGDGRKQSWVNGGLVHGLPTPGHSPTPSEARPVSALEGGQRFWSLPVGEETSVVTQNSLRSILTSQCAQTRTGRRRPRSSGDGSVTDSIWDELSVVSRYMRKGKVDMMLGVGGEVGVSKARLDEVVQLLEKLGCKDGVSRTGRVSLRDLIGAAMQAYTAQPLSKQTQANPFSDRAVLAALIIPYIERYLCSRPQVRFLLIEYPSEHLETILAVQKLMGNEIMRIAGVINGDASALNRPFSPPPSIEVYKSSTAPMSQEDFGSILEALLGSPSFTQADYILPSVASEADTATFLASVQKQLVSVSDFYTPPKTPISEVARPREGTGTRKQVYPALIIKAARTQTTEEYQQQGEKVRHHSIASSGLDTPPASPAESFCPSGLRPPVFRDSAALSRGAMSPRDMAPGSRIVTPTPRNMTPISRNVTPVTMQSPHPLTAQKQMERGGGWGRPRGQAVHLGGQGSTGRPYGFSTGTASSQSLSHNGGNNNRLRQVATLSHLPVTSSYDEEDYGELDEEERRLMPMYGRRRGSGGGGDGKKALKWLGLA